MGSFNTTCAVSGLPIKESDDVRLIFLCKTPQFGRRGGTPAGQVYSHDSWMPVSLAMPAAYDGYGKAKVATPDGLIAQWFLSSLKDALSPVEAGENRFHDVECTVESLTDIHAVQTLCQTGGGRVFVDTLANIRKTQGPMPVGYMMVREEVYTAMSEDYRTWDDKTVTTDETMETALEDLDRYIADKKGGGMIDLAEADYGRLTPILIGHGEDVFSANGTKLTLRSYSQALTELRSLDDERQQTTLGLLRRAVELDVFNANMNALGRPYAPQVVQSDDIEWTIFDKISRITRAHIEECTSKFQEEGTPTP